MKPSPDSHPRHPRAYARIATPAALCTLGALLGLAVLTGCGDRPEASPSERGTIGSIGDSDAPESPAAEEDSPSPSGPAAADGTDYTACEDGECEVAVAEPVEIAVGGADGMTISITVVTENGIEFEMVQANGSIGGSLGGICEAFLTGTSMSSSCWLVGEMPEPQPGDGELVLQLLGMNDGSAVLRMALG